MINSYWLQYDEENDCYTVDIDTGIYCINYPRAKVVFSTFDNMAMPISISVMDGDMNVVDEFSLAPTKKAEQ